MKVLHPASKNLDFNFIDDLLVTGLAVEAANLDDAVTSPAGNVVELYDIANVFLSMHLSDAERLFDEHVGYFSPMLIGAFDLSPEEVGFEPLSQLCLPLDSGH